MLSKTCVNALTLICCLTSIGPLKLFAGGPTTIVELSGDHLAAVNRQRRIIYHHDAGANVHHPLSKVGSEQIADVVRLLVSPLDAPDNQIDSVWYDWSEGNHAVWRSEILPPLAYGAYPGWWGAGHDIVELVRKAAKDRGREVFFSYRINGGDHDFGMRVPPLKKQHPEWTHDAYAGLGYSKRHIFWNFQFKEVRDYKVKVLRELAETYDFDGISVDFARGPLSFPVGTQWLHRDLLTDFMRELRQVMLDVETKRGRPLLLAVRVSANVVGCQFDGIDIRRWAREKLADIFVLGCRSSEVELTAYRSITAGSGIKLYPCFDYVHTSDAYDYPSIELSRGIYTNWWRQGADGAYTFNCYQMDPSIAERLGANRSRAGWEAQCQLFREIGSAATLQLLDKTFFIERRGYGDGSIVPKPEEWWTPRHQYSNTNMLGALPVTIPNNSRADRLLTLFVGDDVNAERDRIEELTLRLALLDPVARDLPAESRNEGVVGARRHKPPPKLYTAKGVEDLIEVRINNLLLERAHVDGGWLVFTVQPQQLALGDNLVGVRIVKSRGDAAKAISIEKLELHVDYR